MEVEPTREIFEDVFEDHPTETVPPTQVMAATGDAANTQEVPPTQRPPRSLEEWVQLGEIFAQSKAKVAAGRPPAKRASRSAALATGPAASSAGAQAMAPPPPPSQATAKARVPSQTPPTQELEPTQQLEPTQDLDAQPPRKRHSYSSASSEQQQQQQQQERGPLDAIRTPITVSSGRASMATTTPATSGRPSMPPSDALGRSSAATTVGTLGRFSAAMDRSSAATTPAAVGRSSVATSDALGHSSKAPTPAILGRRPAATVQVGAEAGLSFSTAMQSATPEAFTTSVCGYQTVVYRRQGPRAHFRDDTGPRTPALSAPMVRSGTPGSQDPPAQELVPVPTQEIQLLPNPFSFKRVPKPPPRQTFIELVQMGIALRDRMEGGASAAANREDSLTLPPVGEAGGLAEAEPIAPDAKRARMMDQDADDDGKEPAEPTLMVPPSDDEASVPEGMDIDCDGASAPAFVDGSGDEPPNGEAREGTSTPIADLVGKGAASDDAGFSPAGADAGSADGRASGGSDDDVPAAQASSLLAVVLDGARPQLEPAACEGSVEQETGESREEAAVSLVRTLLRRGAGEDEVTAAVKGLMLRGFAEGASAESPAQTGVVGQDTTAAAELHQHVLAIARPIRPPAGNDKLDMQPESSQQLELRKKCPRPLRPAVSEEQVQLVGIDAVEASLRELQQKEEETRAQLSALVSEKIGNVEDTIRQLQERKNAVIGVLHALHKMI